MPGQWWSARLVSCSLVLLVTPSGAALGQPAPRPIGQVKVAAGTAAIVRGGQSLVATPGAEVFESDRVRTGDDGRLGLILRDDTRLTLGPGSELDLTRFAYAPEANDLSLALQLVRGVLSYVSGIIAKLAPNAVRVQTPTAVIGVRGTHLLLKVDAP